MFLDIAPNGSTAIQSCFRQFFENASSMEYAFLLSTIFVIIVSILKYTICSKPGKKDALDFSFELPVDVCALLLALILSIFIPEESAIFGAILFGISLFCLVIVCLIRNKATDLYSKNKTGWGVFWLSFEFLIAITWLLIVYHEMP